MKRLVILFILFKSVGLMAQSYYPSVVSTPLTGFEQLRQDNPYILSLVPDGAEWIPSMRYILEVAPNINYTGEDIVSSWADGTWTDIQTTSDSFVLDDQNRLYMVYDKSEYNYPGYTGRSKSKYIFTYNTANQLARLDYFQTAPDTSDNYKKTTVTYFRYDTNGKRILDSNIYYYSGVQISLSHYAYAGDKLSTITQLNGGDTASVTYYTYAGDLLTSTTNMEFDANADEWNLSFTDSFEYNAMNQVTRRATTGYVFRDGALSIEPYRNDFYTYTSKNQLLEEIAHAWIDSTWVNQTKTTITYGSDNKPEVGYVYIAEGNDWSTEASTKYLFEVQTGLKTLSGPLSTIIISPNPANDVITIDMDKQKASIKLFDITGKCVYEQTNVNGQHPIDLTAFTNGVYYALIQNQSYQRTAKIMVRHY